MPLFTALLWFFPLAMSGFDSAETVRIASFNIWELGAAKLNEVDESGRGRNVQLRRAAEIIQRVRPDILLINEIDYDAERRRNAAVFRDRYLQVSQRDQPPIDYAHVCFEAVNTGVPTGLDLDNDGDPTGPADAYGFGRYPGQYGMALYSTYPIDAGEVRTFRMLLWRDMPGHLMPDGQQSRPEWYSPDEAAILRLSSKSHWDVPVRIGDRVLHVLCSHPTPPVFDGPEDRNGRRNFDEIRLWADYLTGGRHAEYIVDDRGRRGGLPADAAFVLLGDLNADPVANPVTYGQQAIEQLLNHPRVRDLKPRSEGAATCSKAYAGDSASRTCDFGRLDYVLPGSRLDPFGCGVFWPKSEDPLHDLVEGVNRSSDHRLVWIDIAVGTLPRR